MRMAWRLAPALLLVACSDTAGVQQTEVLGTVEFYRDPIVVAVPDTVQRGAPFEVSVATYGGGCMWIGPTKTMIWGNTIVVAPYDSTLVGKDAVCTLELKTFPHTVTLAWPSSGEVTVAIHGLVRPTGVERTYLRTVVVR